MNYIDPYGHSTVVQSVLYKLPNILKFFINNGLDVNSQSSGSDALDLALKQFKGDFTFISILMSSGALVKASHINFMTKLQNTDFDKYMLIIGKYPELSK